MTLQILGIILLVILIGLFIVVIIRQHQLKKLQKQNQAIDYIFKRIKENTDSQRTEKLEELVDILKERNKENG